MSGTGQPPNFPVETWESIFQYLTRPADLYNVSITSRYLYNAVQPILYKRLFIDANHYAFYTLALLKNNPSLAHHVSEVILLKPHSRTIPRDVREQADAISRTLELPFSIVTPQSYPNPAPMPGPMEKPDNDGLIPTIRSGCPDVESIYKCFPRFTGLQCFRIIRDFIPSDFLVWITILPQLTTLEIRNSTISPNLVSPPQILEALRLRELIVLGCVWKPVYQIDNDVPAILVDSLIRYSPYLTSLIMDKLLERPAWDLLAEVETAPPIRTFISVGRSQQDSDALVLRSVFNALPTIETLKMARIPRELISIMSPNALPNLKTLSGQIRSIRPFLTGNRPLTSLTIIDTPGSSGTIPWERQLIHVFEALHINGTGLQCLAFSLRSWSEEVFLCVCKLFPKLREFKMYCTHGPGVDQYFRISFGPRFLPILQELEVLHIVEQAGKFICRPSRRLKGLPVTTPSPLDMSEEDWEELTEAPVHYRRWVRICPSLREIAFKKDTWWQRYVDPPGDWTLMRDPLPSVSQDYC